MRLEIETNISGWDSACLGCGVFLARSRGPYTGKVSCQECGAINYFENSNKPLRCVGSSGLIEAGNRQQILCYSVATRKSISTKA